MRAIAVFKRPPFPAVSKPSSNAFSNFLPISLCHKRSIFSNLHFLLFFLSPFFFALFVGFVSTYEPCRSNTGIEAEIPEPPYCSLMLTRTEIMVLSSKAKKPLHRNADGGRLYRHDIFMILVDYQVQVLVTCNN